MLPPTSRLKSRNTSHGILTFYEVIIIISSYFLAEFSQLHEMGFVFCWQASQSQGGVQGDL